MANWEKIERFLLLLNRPKRKIAHPDVSGTEKWIQIQGSFISDEVIKSG